MYNLRRAQLARAAEYADYIYEEEEEDSLNECLDIKLNNLKVPMV